MAKQEESYTAGTVDYSATHPFSTRRWGPTVKDTLAAAASNKETPAPTMQSHAFSEGPTQPASKTYYNKGKKIVETLPSPTTPSRRVSSYWNQRRSSTPQQQEEEEDDDDDESEAHVSPPIPTLPPSSVARTTPRGTNAKSSFVLAKIRALEMQMGGGNSIQIN